ncbi:MAG: hypothetical protein QXQ29_06710 [Candidatus Bathyarchaeia archaeon]
MLREAIKTSDLSPSFLSPLFRYLNVSRYDTPIEVGASRIISKVYISQWILIDPDIRLKVVKGGRIGKMRSLRVYRFGSKSEAEDKGE